MDKSSTKFNPITNLPNNISQPKQNVQKKVSQSNNKTNSDKIKTKNAHSFCNLHNFEIAGCCENFSCTKKQQVFCMKCAADLSFCIREEKHALIGFEEMISDFIDKELYSLKSDSIYSKSYSMSKKFLEDEIKLKNDFLEKSRLIQDEINDFYINLINHVKNLLEDFNQKFEKFVNIKFSSLMNSLDNVRNLISYDELLNFDKERLLKNFPNLNFDELNSLIISMKRTVNNYKKKNVDADLEYIKYVNDMNVKNENIFLINKRFEEIKHDIDQKHMSFCNNIEKNVLLSNKPVLNKNSTNPSNFNSFNSNQRNDYFQDFENTSINNLILFKEFPVDFYVNSNFIDKKFTIFDHSNGNSYLAFPTSQNAIKILYFNRLLQDSEFSCPEESNLDINEDNVNEIVHKNTAERRANGKFGYHKGPQYTTKDYTIPEQVDKHLYYKLMSHGGKIILIRYYRILMNQQDTKDLLITSSEDKSIKIWDISNLNKNLDDVNTYYKNHCVRTILPHENNKISSFCTFYDPIKNKNFIISSGFGDRIKVWDMSTGNIFREVLDSTKNPNFDNELIVFHENVSSKNYMITAGHNSQIRVWDFDSGKTIKSIAYKEKILDLVFYGEDEKKIHDVNTGESSEYSSNSKKNLVEINNCLNLPKIFIVDEVGKCSSLHFEKNDKEIVFNLRNENVLCGLAVKNGGLKWSNNKILLYCKNGQIFEYETYDMFDNFSCTSNNYFNSSGNNENQFKKPTDSILIGNLPISNCIKFRDVHFGDLLVVHTHDQKIKVFKLK